MPTLTLAPRARPTALIVPSLIGLALTGWAVLVGSSLPPPSGLTGPSPAVAVVDVARTLAEDGARGPAATGGVARQLDRGSLAHVFRLEPSDRAALWSTTPRRDFFLEDPIRPASHRGCFGPHRVTVGPADDGVRTVSYVIGGDLWIDTHRATALRVEGVDRVELVVRGDVHIADDLYAAPGTRLAIYALRDPITGGGHIRLEDAAFGSLARVEADLYAEGRIARVAGDVEVRGLTAEGLVLD